jgi:small conductance mechanosensitive channel
MILFQNLLSADLPNTEKAFNRESSIAEMFMGGGYEQILDRFIAGTITFGGKILIALLIFFVGRWIIKKILKLESKFFKKSDMDCALTGFLKGLTKIVLYVALILLIISIVGVETVSLAALIAAAGLAIGFAVKDNLANFAGGVILLMNKPFKGGDHIKAQDVEGIVVEIGILFTQLHTFDNKMIHIPNGPLSTGNIVNMSTQEIRRVDAPAKVEYGASIDEVREALLSLTAKNSKILADPESVVRVIGMNETSIDVQLRVWVKYEDYWEVNWWLNEAIYTELRRRGIGMPFTKVIMQNPNEKA